jgi:hypothetical protein
MHPRAADQIRCFARAGNRKRNAKKEQETEKGETNMAEFLTGFSNILWGAPVLILLGIVGLLYGIRTKFFQIRKMGYILKNTAG